eukprot:m.38819 g.38819  ORF g.38819 m.38819 type:complete len:191 (-) comp10045_c0_seq1:20-592(-)
MARAAIIPGNGCDCDLDKCMWYGWVKRRLEEAGIPTALQTMPDPYVARESIWIPFMHDTLKCDESTIIIGHSSGAEAAMRYAEKYRVKAIVLVSPCVTDMGMASEAASGYYARPWLWDEMARNTSWIMQFSSKDDPLVDFESEQLVVKEGLSKAQPHYTFHEFADRGHFQSRTFPALVQAVTAACATQAS